MKALTPVETALAEFLMRHELTGDRGPLRTKTAGRGDLCDLFRAMGYTRGAEIGVWEGAFSQRLCAGIPGLHLTCVDPWKTYAAYREQKNDKRRLNLAYESALARLAPYHCDVLRMPSLDAATTVADRSLDFAYIDGNHERPFIDQDLAAWLPKVRAGGCICGHDYFENPKKPFIQVKQALDEYTAAHDINPWFVLAGDKSPSWFWVVV